MALLKTPLSPKLDKSGVHFLLPQVREKEVFKQVMCMYICIQNNVNIDVIFILSITYIVSIDYNVFLKRLKVPSIFLL